MRARGAPARGLAALFLLCLLLAGAVALAVRYPDSLVLRLRAPTDGAPTEPGSAAGDGARASPYSPPGEAAFAVIEHRPLFAPDRRPSEDEPEAVGNDLEGPASLDGLALTGIVGAGAQRIAIIEQARAVRGAQDDGKPLSLRVGDDLRGWTVDAIAVDRIVLVKGTMRHELELSEDAARRLQRAPRRTPTTNPPTAAPRQNLRQPQPRQQQQPPPEQQPAPQQQQPVP